MIKVAYFNGTKPSFEILEIEDKLDSYYKLIPCTTIDIVRYKNHDVILDDEGLFKRPQRVTSVMIYNDEIISQWVGGLIICNHDKEGATTSLTDKDIEGLQNNSMYAKILQNDEITYILINRI